MAKDGERNISSIDLGSGGTTVNGINLNTSKLFGGPGGQVDGDEDDIVNLGGDGQVDGDIGNGQVDGEIPTSPQSIDVTKVTHIDTNGNVTGSTLTERYKTIPQKPKVFSYGEGNITAKEYANNIWGDQTTQEDIQEIAKIFAGKKNYDSEADAGLYKVNTESTSKAKLVGQYIGERGGKYNTSYVDELGGSVTGNINEGIKFGQELAEKDNQIDHFSKYIDKNMREEIRTNVENDRIEKILDKLDDGKNLSPEEMEDFKKAKDTYDKAHNQFINVRDQLGFSQEENIYANYNDSDIKTSARFRNKINGNVTYQSLKRNQRLLDYNIEYDSDNKPHITGNKGDYSNSFKKEEPITDFLSEAQSYREFDQASMKLDKDDANIKKTPLEYIKDNNEATYENESAKKLYELKQSGVDIENGDEILRSYMTAHNSGIEQSSNVITYLNKASDEAIKNINISDDNIAYLKEGGLRLTQDGNNFKLSQESINLMTDDERNNKYKKLIDSNDIGKEDLSELNGVLDRRYRENEVLDSLSSTYSLNDIDYTNMSEAPIDNVLQQVQKNVYSVNTTGKKRGRKPERKRTVTGKVDDVIINPELNDINNTDYAVETPFNVKRMTFDDVRKNASSNYDRITGSYAPSEYGNYALSNDEVLNRSGVINENLRKEILGAEKFDDLSPEAMGALYGANSKLSQRDINLGNFKELTNQEIESIEKMNPELGKKLRNISAGDKAQILGRTQEEVSNYLGLDKDGLTSKLEMKRNASLDINDPKVARKVLEDLSNKNPEEALADLIDFTGNRKGYGDLKGGGQANKVLDAFRAGTLEKDLRSGRLEQAYGIVRDTIDEIKSIHGKDFAKEYDQFDAKTNSMKDKFSVENMKKQAKNFDKADYDRIDYAFDKGLEATAKRMENLSGPLTRKSGNLGKVGNFFKGGKGKVALGVAGGMAAIFGVASIAGNAAEERERKRQEMNQLIAAQNANIRSGY